MFLQGRQPPSWWSEASVSSTMPAKSSTHKVEYFSGLDLGQARDPSALAVLERTTGSEVDEAGRDVAHYAVRHLQRWPLGTPYTDLVEAVGKLFAEPPLRDSTLVVDQTGVGRPVVDLFRKAKLPLKLRPVTITAGSGSSLQPGAGFRVAKVELVGALQVLLQGKRLKIAPSLPDAKILQKELQNFRVKVTANANEIFEAWREGDHDDLVLAVACAAWLADRGLRAMVY